MSYPILYKSNETDFTHLGIGVLSESATAFVVEERNGIFEFEMQYPIGGTLFSELKNDRLIKVDASPKLKSQRFKIIRITKPANGFVTVYGEHVSYLAQDLALKPEVSFSGTALSALNTWRMNLVDGHPFTVYSDVQTTGSGKWTIDKVENARRALGGVEGSLLDIYGGEYRFDNYHIGLYLQRGDESEALIAYGKNIMDLTQEEEIASTYTSIYPFAILRDDESGELLTLPEYFVDSEHVSKYARRKIQVVDFSQDEIDTVAKLRTRAEEYINQNSVGVPKVNLKVKFIDLSKTLDYEHLKMVEEINLCDLVTIYFDKLDIKTKAKVIKVTWNVLLDRYEEIEIGEARSSLSNAIVHTIDGKIERVQQRITTVQIAANGKNRIFRGLDQPTAGMSSNDLWYKPVGDGETELYRFDGAYWKLEKVSAGLLGGTLDAENGDVNLINVNVANIVGETSDFVKSWWNNAAGGSVDIDGNGIVTQSGELLTRISAGKVMIANSKKDDGSWDWRTAITGDGIIADEINTGTLKADLIQSGFNDIAYGVIMTEDGLYNVSERGYYTHLGSGNLRFFTDDDELNGMLSLAYSGDRTGMAVFAEVGHGFSVIRRRTGGQPNKTIFQLPDDVDELRMSAPFNANGNAIKDAGTIEAHAFRIKNTNQYIANIVGGGGAYFDSQKVSLGIGNDSGVNMKVTVTEDSVDLLAPVNSNYPISAPSYNLKGTSQYLISSSNIGGSFIDTQKVSLGIGTPASWTNYLSVLPNQVDIFRELDLNGYTIVNQSDIRLKKNITDASFDAMREIERIRVIEHEWDMTNPRNKDKPEGKHFGIEAQSSPFLQLKAGDDESYLSVDLVKQINLLTLAEQQHIKRTKEIEKELEETKTELADLKSILHEKGLI